MHNFFKSCGENETRQLQRIFMRATKGLAAPASRYEKISRVEKSERIVLHTSYDNQLIGTDMTEEPMNRLPFQVRRNDNQSGDGVNRVQHQICRRLLRAKMDVAQIRFANSIDIFI